MTAINFEHSLTFVLRSEGGYVNNPHDPGGATNHGVTQRVYDSYRRSLAHLPVRSVRLIGSDEVATIYRRQYWHAIKGDELPAGLDYAVFDFAVNSGPRRASRDLQRLLGVKVDGWIGLVTLGAIPTFAAQQKTLINAYCDHRLSWLRRLSSWRYFGKGWTNRVESVRKNALTMVK